MPEGVKLTVAVLSMTVKTAHFILKESNPMKRVLIPLTVLLLAVAVSAVAYVVTRPATPMALAELSVRNLTCGSCVSNVQQAVSGIDGVGQVEIIATYAHSDVCIRSAEHRAQRGRAARAHRQRTESEVRR